MSRLPSQLTDDWLKTLPLVKQPVDSLHYTGRQLQNALKQLRLVMDRDDPIEEYKVKSRGDNINFFTSSSPQAFPIIWGRRNGIEYHSSTLSCPVRHSPLTPRFPYRFYIHESFHLVFCLPLHFFPGTGASNILLSTCPSSLLLTCLHHFSLFSVIFFLTGAIFTDLLLTCNNYFIYSTTRQSKTFFCNVYKRVQVIE